MRMRLEGQPTATACLKNTASLKNNTEYATYYKEKRFGEYDKIRQ